MPVYFDSHRIWRKCSKTCSKGCTNKFSWYWSKISSLLCNGKRWSICDGRLNFVSPNHLILKTMICSVCLNSLVFIGFDKVIWFLLEPGANKDLRDSMGNTALMATKNGSFSQISKLTIGEFLCNRFLIIQQDSWKLLNCFYKVLQKSTLLTKLVNRYWMSPHRLMLLNVSELLIMKDYPTNMELFIIMVLPKINLSNVTMFYINLFICLQIWYVCWQHMEQSAEVNCLSHKIVF